MAEIYRAQKPEERERIDSVIREHVRGDSVRFVAIVDGDRMPIWIKGWAMNDEVTDKSYFDDRTKEERLVQCVVEGWVSGGLLGNRVVKWAYLYAFYGSPRPFRDEPPPVPIAAGFILTDLPRETGTSCFQWPNIDETVPAAVRSVRNIREFSIELSESEES